MIHKSQQSKMREQYFKSGSVQEVLNYFGTLQNPLHNKPKYCTTFNCIVLTLLKNVDIKLNQMEQLAKLPSDIHRKVETLKKLQLEQMEKEAAFHRQVHSMEMEYQLDLKQIYSQRRAIVKGVVDDALKPEAEPTCTHKGIPEFWLRVFKSVPVLSSMILEKDEAVLKHLVDVRVEVRDKPVPSFVLHFEFEPNDFFENEILTKEYLLECDPGLENMADFSGFQIFDTNGCEILWKEGVNVIATENVDADGVNGSFFDFFNPKALKESFDSIVYKDFLEFDFEIGYLIKERIIPKAVLYFNGEYMDLNSEFLRAIAGDRISEDAIQ
ncbi:nucleosome assembly protein 1-like 1 [Uranotaenia lowii]|uniref:nucleosome assembly protein 1-like 1 n=1 Tax=Uranotaenia lowii TaxID=190385 RepID=UPI00247B25F2|nr:nucleosome assembly protein 1-like 1 [Uranotaenia lowii]